MEEEYFYSHELFKQNKNRDTYAKLENIIFTKDRHIGMIHSCHRDLYGSEKFLQQNTIKAAAHILPNHNKIFFDCRGHCAGHQVCLPINAETYQEIKEQKTIEYYLTCEMIVDIIKLSEGVFFYYSIFAVNISISSGLASYGFNILSKIKHKDRYLLSSHTITKESAIIQKHLCMRLVKDYASHHGETRPAIYEMGLDYHMRINGPVETITEQAPMKNLNKNMVRRTKQVWSPAIPTINQEILLTVKKHKKHSTGKIEHPDALRVDKRPDALTVDKDRDELSVDFFSPDGRKWKYQKKSKAHMPKFKIAI